VQILKKMIQHSRQRFRLFTVKDLNVASYRYATKQIESTINSNLPKPSLYIAYVVRLLFFQVLSIFEAITFLSNPFTISHIAKINSCRAIGILIII
jgi:hypothetical protein